MKTGVKIVASLIAAVGMTCALGTAALAEEQQDSLITPEQTIVISVEGTQYTLGVDTPLAIDVTKDGLVNKDDMKKMNIQVVSFKGKKLKNVGTQSGVLDNQGRPVLEYNFAKVGCDAYAVRLSYHAGDDPEAANDGCAFERFATFMIEGAKVKGSTLAAPAGVKASGGKGTATVSCTKMPNADGYTVQVFSGKKKVAFAAKAPTAGTKTKVVVKGLKKGTYQVRIAATAVLEDINSDKTKKVTGKWSAKKTITVK